MYDLAIENVDGSEIKYASLSIKKCKHHILSVHRTCKHLYLTLVNTNGTKGL